MSNEENKESVIASYEPLPIRKTMISLNQK